MEIEKKQSNHFIVIAAVVIIIIAAVLCIFVFNGNDSGKSPEACVTAFCQSVLPDYNKSKLIQSVGEKAFPERFNDGGYFEERLSRSKQSIEFYYGENFKCELDDFSLIPEDDSQKNAILKEYENYSLSIEDAVIVKFKITLSGDGKENSRYEKIRAIKIKNLWYVYDYDAYWFAFM